MEEKRLIYLDYIRILATLSVIMAHVSCVNWLSSRIGSFEWCVFNFYDSISRWSVDGFVMISGALFLKKDIKLKRLYKHSILKLVIIYIIWSEIYGLIDYVEGVRGGLDVRYTLKTFILGLINGHFHLWFIPMIIGVYMCIPFIKAIKEKGLTRYFLLLSFLFSSLFPQFLLIVGLYGGEGFSDYIKAIENYNSSMHLKMIMEYMGLFLLGDYLNEKTFEGKKKNAIYILGIVGTAYTIVMTYMTCIVKNEVTEAFFDNFAVGVIFSAIGIFVFLKNLKLDEKLNPFVVFLSKNCFGVYLIHVLIINVINNYIGITTLSFNPIFACLIICIMTYFISLVIVAGTKRIFEGVRKSFIV